jgi:pimeloyl-ACP methyl ester carboxylesterase
VNLSKHSKVHVSTLIVAAFLACTVLACGQKTSINGESATRVFRSVDSTQNFYLALEPTAKPKGLLVILPGFGTMPGGVLDETDLPTKARKDGYLVIIPYLATGTMYYDSLSQARLATLVPEVIRKYTVPKNKFLIGGHSAGGNGALLYAENAMKESNAAIVKPNAVFAVDPPLDMKRLWRLFEYIHGIKFSDVSTNEADYFLDRMRQDMGGTPDEKPERFEKASSLYRDAASGGKIQYLKSVPVRLYCDPDVNWYIDNRRIPLELINATDLSASIVQLKLLGNEKAELIANPGKGYLAGGVRHPHAFSQLDADEFLQWARTCLQ